MTTQKVVVISALTTMVGAWLAQRFRVKAPGF